jgi:hypothetical protein
MKFRYAKPSDIIRLINTTVDERSIVQVLSWIYVVICDPRSIGLQSHVLNPRVTTSESGKKLSCVYVIGMFVVLGRGILSVTMPFS